MAEREGITETLKAENQMLWVGKMNALRSAVTETVNAEVIFVWESGSIPFISRHWNDGIYSMLSLPTETSWLHKADIQMLLTRFW